MNIPYYSISLIFYIQCSDFRYKNAEYFSFLCEYVYQEANKSPVNLFLQKQNIVFALRPFVSSYELAGISKTSSKPRMHTFNEFAFTKHFDSDVNSLLINIIEAEFIRMPEITN